MNFHQYVTYKTLGQMYSFGESNSDFAMQIAPPDVLKQHMRNVCAMVPNHLFDSLEGMCTDLEISKRKFVEMALIEAIAKAKQIMEEVGMHDYISDAIESHQNAVLVEVDQLPESEAAK